MNRRSFLTSTLTSAVSIGILSKTSLAIANTLDGACDISPPVLSALTAQSHLQCAELTPDILAQVTELQLAHIHINNFKETDFADLKNLKKLYFYSLFHKNYHAKEIKAFSRVVFAPLTALEDLTIDEELGELDADVFADLKSVQILDFANSSFDEKPMPTSLLYLDQLKNLYMDPSAVTPEEYDALKQVYGERLQAIRPS